MDNAALARQPRTSALAKLLASLETDGAEGTVQLLDALPFGLALLDGSDERLRVLHVNSELLRLTASAPAQILRRPLRSALDAPPEMLQAVNQARRRGAAGVRYEAADGRLWDFEAVGLGDLERGARLLATWHEVREPEPAQHRVGAESRAARLYEQAQSRARRLQVGVDVALEVATRLDPGEVVERIVHRPLEAVEAERVMLGRMEGDRRCTVLGLVDPSAEGTPVGHTVSLDKKEPAMEAVATRQPAQGHFPSDDVGLRPLKWTLVVPLVVGSEPIALLCVSRDSRRFEEDEIALLQQIGAIAGLALRNAILFQTLGEASRAHIQFLNMAAHELRTPLSVIAGYVSMLADGTLGQGPPSWQAPLAVLVQKTSELAHLVDDILLAGRLESGTTRTAGRIIDLSEALREAVRRARARAELIAASVDVRAPAGRVLVRGDLDHVARIIDNLVNNAFNYSGGQPCVKVSLETDGGWALLRVEDSGRGIDGEHRERIFQQFYRVDDPAAGYPPGTGLGLFISRGLAERSGGRLDLEWSEPGVGSAFLLRLPLALSERAEEGWSGRTERPSG